MLFDESNGSILPKHTSLPELQKDEILVKNKYTTLCGSDLHTFTGRRKEPSPIVLGHEIVGEIMELPHNESLYDLNGNILKVGDLITWTIFAATETDDFVKDKMPQKSASLFKYGHVQFTEKEKFNGGLGTHCILKKGTGILKVPATINEKFAPIINCAGATAMAAHRLIYNIENKNVLILGAGVLGLIAAAIAKEKKASTVTMLDIDDQRLEKSKAFGVDSVYNSLKPIEELTAITSGFYKKGFDVIIDMSGSVEAIKTGLQFSAVGAQHIWIGAVTPTENIEINPEVMIRKLLSIKGMHNYNYEDFVNAVSFFENHFLDYPFETFIEKEFGLNETKEAFEYAIKHKPYRVLITI
ncbi:alcohol dehydrogenase [Flavobacterium cutihirudinis]|uniref:Alcohol dehydrogenase n=2 Tax=Flavobacterium cutihirudinis TaxID=1265740 RepID=A0A3D9FSW0_9FLAO|nr:alcohol dehydrogenase [Flavobacterium cutihirudinis]